MIPITPPPTAATLGAAAATTTPPQLVQRRLRRLGSTLRKWLQKMRTTPQRPQRHRHKIDWLYFGWFGGVQGFYRPEREP
jgi:hypothetical protein